MFSIFLLQITVIFYTVFSIRTFFLNILMLSDIISKALSAYKNSFITTIYTIVDRLFEVFISFYY